MSDLEDNDLPEHYLTQSEIQDDDLESPERPKTLEGFPPQEEFDLLYNSKYDMEESEEPSPPSSQYEPRHKEYPQHKKKESSLPKGPGEHKSRKRKYMDTVSFETNKKIKGFQYKTRKPHDEQDMSSIVPILGKG